MFQKIELTLSLASLVVLPFAQWILRSSLSRDIYHRLDL
jgi:hypothetical protein